MNKRERRTYTAEFKNQIVQLYLNNKPRQDIEGRRKGKKANATLLFKIQL
jgi:transposase-like protein